MTAYNTPRFVGHDGSLVPTKKTPIVLLMIVLLIFLFFAFFFPPTPFSAAQEPYNVVEKVDYTITYVHQDPKWTQPYYDFPDLYPEYQAPMTEQDFVDWVNQVTENELWPERDPISREQMRDEIIDALNIRFLLEGIDARELVVTTIAETDRGRYTERWLLFEDPNIGTFEVLLLVPTKAAVQMPAIIWSLGVHETRGDWGVEEILRHGAEALVERGFIVIGSSYRAEWYDWREENVVLHLATRGFNLVGLRVYETLLLVKYLKYLDYADHARIGMIGYSHGASVNNLVVRISDDISAAVTDMYTTYCEVDTEWTENTKYGYYDETAPALASVQELIRDETTLPFPLLEIAYHTLADPAVQQQVQDFIVQQLEPDRTPAIGSSLLSASPAPSSEPISALP
jgi:hypothetical protein